MMKRLALFGAFLAVALGGATQAGAAEARSVAYTTSALPAFPALGTAVPARGTAISNQSLARIFTTLTLDMEWGASRRNLVRYERPVSVGLEGPGISQYTSFLDGFLADLRNNTGVNIARQPSGQNLHIRFVGSEFNRLLPTVSCLVAPGNLGWKEFSKNPGRYGGRALVKARAIDHMTIFIPQTAAPYLVRNCLLEEVTQALGTANDLYGLGDSIFNDDAAHVWPTELDYLMLRVLYNPQMRTGMDRETTERTALAVLDRVNPAGIGAPPLLMPAQRRMAGWRQRIQRVFSRKTEQREALRLAEEALDIARAKAPGSAYHCHSLITLGRVVNRSSAERAVQLFDEAKEVCSRVHGPQDIRIARIGMERANALLKLGRFDEVIPLTDEVLPILAAHGQDERISALYALQSAALAAIGDRARAQAAQALAAEWGAYSLGVDSEVLARWLKG